MPVATRSKTVSAQESLVLVRNLMRCSISTIAYLRNVFPDENFADRTMSGVNLKSLLPNSEETQLVIEWLEKGVFDALQKQYLRVVSFVVLDEAKDQVLENYDFKVKYPSSGPQLSMQANGSGNAATSPVQTKEEVARSIRVLLRRLITLTQSMAELPDERVITMRVRFDPSTPKDYQPPFFSEASEAAKKQMLRGEDGRVDLKLGAIHTLYHSMDLRCRAPREWLEMSQPEPRPGPGDEADDEAGDKVPKEAPKEEQQYEREQRRAQQQCGGDGGDSLESTLARLDNLSSHERAALKTLAYVATQGEGGAPFYRLKDRLDYDDRTVARVGAQLAAWNLLCTTPGAASSGQDVLQVDTADARTRAALAALLPSGLAAYLEPHELAVLEEAVCGAPETPDSAEQAEPPSRRGVKRSRAEMEEVDNTQTTGTFFGDEPKVSAIERPVRQRKV